jgi:hypothetical protein
MVGKIQIINKLSTQKDLKIAHQIIKIIELLQN